MKIHFAYYNQYKNGIDIAFADNTLLFLSCAEAEKNLHTTPNSQKPSIKAFLLRNSTLASIDLLILARIVLASICSTVIIVTGERQAPAKSCR